MDRLRTRAGVALGVVAGLFAVVVALASFRVWTASSPPRHDVVRFDFESMRLPVEDYRFSGLDGTSLAGWLLRADPGAPAIVLCHDLGSSRSEMVDLAIELNDRGYSTFMFDFRAHGDSDGRLSTLGLKEKRDVLGALDFLRDLPGVDADRIGLYGVGMGAHAAVLAAADRRQALVLVLDGLYPDAGYSLIRRFWSGWEPGIRHFSGLPRAVFEIFSGSRIGAQRADQALAGLTGRDLLLLASESDAALMAEMQRMYRTIPDQPDHDGNLLILPGIQSAGLYGDNLVLHHDRVVEFFLSRLRPLNPGRLALFEEESPGGGAAGVGRANRLP